MRYLLPLLAGALLACLLPGCEKPERPVEIAEWQCAEDVMADDDGAPFDFSSTLPNVWWPRPVCVWHSGLDIDERVPARFDEHGRLVDFDMPERDIVMRLWVLDGERDARRDCADTRELGWPVDDIADLDVSVERIGGLDQATCGESRCCRTALCGQYLWTWDDARLRRSVLSIYHSCSGPECRVGAAGVGQVCDTWDADDRCVPGDTVPCPIAPQSAGCTYAAPDHAVTCTDQGQWPMCRTPDEVCDGVDQDCDDTFDEGFDLTTDVLNCGMCGRVCAFDNAVARCTDGVCGFEDCAPGYANNDGRADNGCEYACQPGDARDEICNGIDDDCDGTADEEPPGVGVDCVVGSGACARTGEMVCDVEPVPGVGAGDGAQPLSCNAQPGMPGAEVCNGVDDDCNGETDDVAGIGDDCQRGDGACLAHGVWVCSPDADSDEPVELHCTAEPGLPVDEMCNGIDDDCDLAVDELPELGQPCSEGDGECRADGVWACAAEVGTGIERQVACTAQAGVPSDEVCNGLDDDCNTQVDDLPELGEPCSVGVGACAAQGELTCDAAVGSGLELDVRCTAQPGEPGVEVCNGIDDDCDGTADEGDPGAGDACTLRADESPELLGRCRTGLTVCVDGANQCDTYDVERERCDDLDWDCDGARKNTFRDGEECAVGVGACTRPGHFECAEDGSTDLCNASPGDPEDELCDGLDNDCDGRSDEMWPRLGQDCDVGAGVCLASGVIECQPDGYGLRCTAVSGAASIEECNGLDDDCDGRTDEDFDPRSDPLNCGACGRQCGAPGARMDCVDGECVIGECEPGRVDQDGRLANGCECHSEGVETCDGLDNTCDGLVDEDIVFDQPECAYKVHGLWHCTIKICEPYQGGTRVRCQRETEQNIHHDVVDTGDLRRPSAEAVCRGVLFGVEDGGN